MIDYKRVFTILFLACLLALMCVFALNWSTAHSNDQHTVNLPVIFNNSGLPTPAPTMPVETPVNPTPAPTPTPQVICVEVWYENSHGLECKLAEYYIDCVTTCDERGCRNECQAVFYPTEMP